MASRGRPTGSSWLASKGAFEFDGLQFCSLVRQPPAGTLLNQVARRGSDCPTVRIEEILHDGRGRTRRGSEAQSFEAKVANSLQSLGHLRDNFRRSAAVRPCRVNDDQAARPLDRVRNGFDVEWAQ